MLRQQMLRESGVGKVDIAPLVERRVREEEWRVDAAVLKWHTRRVTAMAFHPLALHMLISGDKSGAIHTLNIDTELGHSVDRNVPTPSTLHPPPSSLHPM